MSKSISKKTKLLKSLKKIKFPAAESHFSPAPPRESLLDTLNPEQKQAVLHGEGPLLVLAGAGTGKTKVLTHRIAHLISTKKARPEEILALTFTEKAAQEMEERVDRLVPYGYVNSWIGTFHAFGDQIIKDHSLELSLPLDYQLLTEAEQVLFFLDHLFEMPLQRLRPSAHPEDTVRSLCRLFSRAKDEDIGPAEYLALAQALPRQTPEEKDEADTQLEIGQTYAAYDKLMKETGKIDFGDQVWLPLKLFRQYPAFLKRYQERFHYILIDEFQDTNRAQFELVKLLAGSRANLTAVGDDDQSIYKFRGAALSNLLSFTDVYPQASKVVLSRNYRSTQEILDSAYRLIQNNNPDRLEIKIGINKKLIAQSGVGKFPQYKHHDVLDYEADQVAQWIMDKVKAEEYRYQDVAILVRNNNDADHYLRALNMLFLPYHFSGNRGLYEKNEIRLLLAFLKSVTDFYDSVNLYFLSTSRFYKIPEYDLMVLNSYARRMNRPLREILETRAALPELKLTVEAEKAVAKMLNDLNRYLKLARDLTTGELIYQFLLESGYLKQLARHSSAASEEALGHVAKFFEIVRHFSRVAQVDRAFEFVKHLELLKRAGDDPGSGEADFDLDAVNVMTIHKAKGLEFPVVFMVSLVDKKFPTTRRRQALELPDVFLASREILPLGDYHLQEERRLFYVGMTRAKKELFFTSSSDLGGKKLRKVSPFVLEALDLPKTVSQSTSKSSKQQAISRNAPLAQGSQPQAPRVLRLSADETLVLSHRQVDDYETCPLKYKYLHIIKIPILSHHQVVYGNALHQAVSAYLTAKKSGRKASLEEVNASFKAAWRSEGFLHRDHEERRFQEGLACLKRFYENEEAQGIIPFSVEQAFSFKRDGLIVKGRFDRVDGEGADAVIVDYKSSDVFDQDKADGKAKENLQLAMYSLAHRELTGVLPKQVELRFLESGLVGTAVKTDNDLEKAWASVMHAAEGIRAGDYTAKPDAYTSCRYCAYREICPDAAG